MIVETDRVRSAGLTFPNDFIFWLSAKFQLCQCFIMLIEYVRGRRAQ
ncbi:hypothetical protein DMI62_00185 [Escherichia coli]|nr:hypothetical protein [Escherichia coli]